MAANSRLDLIPRCPGRKVQVAIQRVEMKSVTMSAAEGLRSAIPNAAEIILALPQATGQFAAQIDSFVKTLDLRRHVESPLRGKITPNPW